MSETDEARLLQAYRAASAALDESPDPSARAAILAAAARAAQPPRPKPAAPRWRLPLAAAASLLVGAIAVVLATRVETPPTPLAARAPDAVDAERRAAAPPVSDEATQAPAAAGRSGRETPAAPPAVAKPARGKAGGTAARPADAASVAAAPASAESERAAAPAPRAEAQPRPAAAPVAQGQPDGAAATADAAPPQGARSPESYPWRRAPQAWIEHIVRLRGQGRHDEADAELARLRARHPTLAIPASALRSEPAAP